MADNIQFLIQQIKDNCKWYFAHEVQIITFYIRQTGIWHAIVYPADCTLATASSTDIHLHCSEPGNLYTVVNTLRYMIHGLIGDRFCIGDAGEIPVIQESEAPCNCQKLTAPLTVAEQVARSVENEASEEVDPDREPATARVTTDSGSPIVQPSAARDIWPVLLKIESTLEGIQQQMHHLPVEPTTPPEARNMDRGAGPPGPTALSTEQVVTMNADQLNAQPVGSSGLPGVSPTESEIAVMELFLSPSSSPPTSAPYSGTYLTHEAARSPSAPTGDATVTPGALSDGVDGHTRDLVREEIGRVLAVAMNSLGGLARGGVDGGS